MNDLEERAPLDPIDPGTRIDGFWIRFHAGVMDRAAPELARRRREVELGFAEVVFAWRRALVPLSLLAAALAGVLLLSPKASTDPPLPMVLEEALMLDLGSDPIPAVLAREAQLDEVAFLTMSGRR